MFISILHIVVTVSLIVIVLLQSGKQAGLSGSIAGGAETFFGKNKGRTLDAILSKYTSIAAILFIVTSVALSLILN
jgi:preprotein translocase subunit SecG